MALERMPSDDYKIVIKARHEDSNVLTIDEVVVTVPVVSTGVMIKIYRVSEIFSRFLHKYKILK